MRVKIIPHGALRKTWPHGYECEAETAYQAINAFQRQHGLRKQVQVRVLGFNSEAALKCPLRVPEGELHVVPDFSGGGGVFRIVVGVVLIAVAAVASYFLPAVGYPLLTAAVNGTFGIGLSLVLGGISELLTPTPKTANPNASQDAARYLGAPQNTTAIGTRIPLGYGRFQVYGQYLSFGIQADLTITDGGSRYNLSSASVSS